MALNRDDDKTKFRLYACVNRSCDEYQKLVLRNINKDKVAELSLTITNIELMELFDE